MSSAIASLRGKRVLVTGGVGGVGRAVASRMVTDGARVLITDLSEEEVRPVAEALRAGQGDAEIDFVAADLAEESGIARMFERVDGWLGGLDILVACAGIGSGPLLAMSAADWRRVIQTNLVSYVAATQGAVERMRAEGIRHGMIILVGSISVHIKAVGESVYNAAKGGVACFAETLRKELIPSGIRVTLIEPGAINSAMQPFAAEERARLAEAYQLLPPDEVAEAILFAATRAPGVDIVTLRIEPLVQKIV